MKWAIGGRELRPLPDIVRGLIALPFYHALRALLVAVTFIGWGLHQAKSLWRDTQ